MCLPADDVGEPVVEQPLVPEQHVEDLRRRPERVHEGMAVLAGQHDPDAHHPRRRTAADDPLGRVAGREAHGRAEHRAQRRHLHHLPLAGPASVVQSQHRPARSIDSRHDVDEVDAETERFTVVEPAHEEVAGQRQHDQVRRQVVDVRADPAKARDVDDHETWVGVDQRLQRRERLDPPTRAEIGDDDVSTSEERVDVTDTEFTPRPRHETRLRARAQVCTARSAGSAGSFSTSSTRTTSAPRSAKHLPATPADDVDAISITRVPA